MCFLLEYCRDCGWNIIRTDYNAEGVKNVIRGFEPLNWANDCMEEHVGSTKSEARRSAEKEKEVKFGLKWRWWWVGGRWKNNEGGLKITRKDINFHADRQLGLFRFFRSHSFLCESYERGIAKGAQ